MGGKGREYDFTVYSIVKYFAPCMENNPNMADTLFTDPKCVIHGTPMAFHVRDQRKDFLHKGCWHKFKGYAYSQLTKMKSQTRKGKRAEVGAKYGYDLKFAMHCVRLMDEVEQILVTGDLDLTRNAEQLKSIRRGEWTLDRVESLFVSREKRLRRLTTKASCLTVPTKRLSRLYFLSVLKCTMVVCRILW